MVLFKAQSIEIGIKNTQEIAYNKIEDKKL